MDETRILMHSRHICHSCLLCFIQTLFDNRDDDSIGFGPGIDGKVIHESRAEFVLEKTYNSSSQVDEHGILDSSPAVISSEFL